MAITGPAPFAAGPLSLDPADPRWARFVVLRDHCSDAHAVLVDLGRRYRDAVDVQERAEDRLRTVRAHQTPNLSRGGIRELPFSASDRVDVTSLNRMLAEEKTFNQKTADRALHEAEAALEAAHAELQRLAAQQEEVGARWRTMKQLVTSCEAYLRRVA